MLLAGLVLIKVFLLASCRQSYLMSKINFMLYAKVRKLVRNTEYRKQNDIYLSRNIEYTVQNDIYLSLISNQYSIYSNYMINHYGSLQ